MHCVDLTTDAQAMEAAAIHAARFWCAVRQAESTALALRRHLRGSARESVRPSPPPWRAASPAAGGSVVQPGGRRSFPCAGLLLDFPPPSH